MKLIPKVVERGYYTVVKPVIDWFIRSGIRPNTITTIGTGFVLVSAVMYAFGQVRWGGLLLLLSGAWDTLDGSVARATGQVTKFGAFYDSTLDRVGDGATFMGIATWVMLADDVAFRIPMVVVSMVAITASLLVSYARARAEGLGIDCKVGLVQRAERIVGLGVPSLVIGAGPHGLVLEAIVAVLAVGSIITVVQRFLYVYRVTTTPPAPVVAARTEPVALDPLAKGHSQ